MKKRISIVFALLLSSLFALASGNLTPVWNKGVNHYTQKQYDSALFYFEKVAATKPQNAEVYYNLGNTYYRLNKVANAVINYERAIRLNPDYKEAKENLALAKGRIPNMISSTNDIFFVKWWQWLTLPSKANMWAILTLIPFCIVIAIMTLKRLKPATRSFLPIQLSGVLWVTTICFLIIGVITANNRQNSGSAVVMMAESPLLPQSRQGKPIAIVPEGTTVSIISDKTTWIEVRLPDGRTGWLQAMQLEKI